MPRTIRIAQIAIIANSNFLLPCDKWRATSLQFGSDVLLCCRPFGPLLRIGAISHSLSLSRSRSRINPDRRKKGRKGGQCKNYTTLSTAEHHPPPCCTHTETAKGGVSLHNFVSHTNQTSRLQGFILNGRQGRVNYTHERRQTQGNKIAQNLIMPTQSAHAFRKSEHFFPSCSKF